MDHDTRTTLSALVVSGKIWIDELEGLIGDVSSPEDAELTEAEVEALPEIAKEVAKEAEKEPPVEVKPPPKKVEPVVEAKVVASDWDDPDSVIPPVLANPTVFLGLDKATVRDHYPHSDYNCGGKDNPFYYLKGSEDKDLFLDLSKLDPDKPIVADNWRDVIILAPEMTAQGGCPAGAKRMHQGRKNPRSAHSRLPWHALLYVSCWRHLHIEGANVNCDGYEIDALVSNTPVYQDKKSALKARTTTIAYSRLYGMEGTDDGIHGDAFHNQRAGISHKLLKLHNVVSLSSYNHFTAQAGGGPWGMIDVKNLYCDLDPAHARNQSNAGISSWKQRPDGYGGPSIVGKAAKSRVDGLYYRNHSGDMGICVGRTAAGKYAWQYASRYIDGSETGRGGQEHSDSMFQIPGGRKDFDKGEFASPVAQCDFAPESKVGKNYVSPFESIYAEYRRKA